MTVQKLTPSERRLVNALVRRRQAKHQAALQQPRKVPGSPYDASSLPLIEARDDISRNQLSGAPTLAPNAGQALDAARRGNFTGAGGVYGPDGSNLRNISPAELRQVQQEFGPDAAAEARRRSHTAASDAIASRRVPEAEARAELDAAAEGRERTGPVLSPDEIERRRGESAERHEQRRQENLEREEQRSRYKFLTKEARNDPSLRNELNNLHRSRTAIETSPRFTPEEKEQLRKQVDERVKDLSRSLGFDDDPEAGREPSLQEQFQKEVFTAEDGTPYTRDQHGGWRVLPGWKPTEKASSTPATYRDWIRENPKDFREMFLKPLMEPNPETGAMPEPGPELYDRAEKMAEEWHRRFIAPGSAAGTPGASRGAGGVGGALPPSQPNDGDIRFSTKLGRAVSRTELESTARARGISVAELKKLLEIE